VSNRLAWLLSFTLVGVPLAAQQEGDARMTRGAAADTHEDGQPAKLPRLPSGMTIAMIVQGDSLFRSKGGCQTCHGREANGMPDMGSGITSGLLFIPPEWGAIDSLIQAGISEPVTRTTIAMPARGAASNLTPEESRLIAAYVWAISHTKGEPWQGGHKSHGQQGQQAAQAE
jgi:cytochrome c5